MNNGGNGVVTSAPAGIDCGADCGETYGGGVNVTLTAAPDPGFRVDAWTGCDVVAGNICHVNTGANRVVGVTFTPVPNTFTLTVVVNAPPGSIGGIIGVLPAGNAIDCRLTGGPVCSQAFAPGTVVSVRPTSTSLELMLFGAWTSGCDSVGPGLRVHRHADGRSHGDGILRTVTVTTRCACPRVVTTPAPGFSVGTDGRPCRCAQSRTRR